MYTYPRGLQGVGYRLPNCSPLHCAGSSHARPRRRSLVPALDADGCRRPPLPFCKPGYPGLHGSILSGSNCTILTSTVTYDKLYDNMYYATSYNTIHFTTIHNTHITLHNIAYHITRLHVLHALRRSHRSRCDPGTGSPPPLLFVAGPPRLRCPGHNGYAIITYAYDRY